MEKRALRRECFARVKSLTAAEKAAFSSTLVDHLADLNLFREAGTVFSYAAMASEPDLASLRASFPGKRWGLSRVADDGESLHFHEVAADQSLVTSPFGFQEPDPAISPVMTGPDLVLVPGVGFNFAAKARLGRGKGHYDRYLGPLMEAENAPTVIGVCFATQEIQLTPEAHDVPMDLIVTENGLM